jgi:hypothetical protein
VFDPSLAVCSLGSNRRTLQQRHTWGRESN